MDDVDEEVPAQLPELGVLADEGEVVDDDGEGVSLHLVRLDPVSRLQNLQHVLLQPTTLSNSCRIAFPMYKIVVFKLL